jgi:hypothetical protein
MSPCKHFGFARDLKSKTAALGGSKVGKTFVYLTGKAFVFSV